MSPARHVFDRNNGLIQLAPVGVILGPCRLLDRPELHKGILRLHVNAHQFAVGLKEHLQVFLSGRFLVVIDDKQGVVGHNRLVASVFLALDASIPACKFGTDRVTDFGNVPVG